MKIFIELPTWIGDCVMATPAIENLIKHYPDAELTLFGTNASMALFAEHPHVKQMICDKSKMSFFRWSWLYSIANSLSPFNIAISFRSSFASKVLLFFLQANHKCVYRKNKKIQKHQVLRYNDFINEACHLQEDAGDLKLYMMPEKGTKATLGINPGASYGSAKRWYPEKFAEVAMKLSKQYDIIIFGGPSEVDIAADIETELIKYKIHNYKNIAGKTSIETLCQKIGGLDLFITGDSGPMHIAAAFKVPTVAIFGPTKENETSPWRHAQSAIVKKEMVCAPCMQRRCPLKHHECMTFISSQDVVEAVKALNLTQS